MIRRLAALATLGIVGAAGIDRLLARRRGANPPRPLEMLVVVDAPIEETWEVVADVPLQTEWMREMKRVRMLTPGPLAVGSRGEATVRIFGIAVTDPVEVIELEPPTRYAIRHEGLFTGGGLITLESGSDGTTTIVRWQETLVAPVLPELAAVMMGPILRMIFQDDLHRLRRLVETGSADR